MCFTNGSEVSKACIVPNEPHNGEEAGVACSRSLGSALSGTYSTVVVVPYGN